MKTENFAT